MPPPTSNPPPATPASTRCCPRSSCGSKSNWPRPASRKAGKSWDREVLGPGGSWDREVLGPGSSWRLEVVGAGVLIVAARGVLVAHRFRQVNRAVYGFRFAGDIVCHMTPLYKARADRLFSAALHHRRA